MKKLLFLIFVLAICCSIFASCKDATTTSTQINTVSKPEEASSEITSQPQEIASSKVELTPEKVESTPKETVSKEVSKPASNHKHSYTKKVVKPTCTKNGYTKYTCKCGDSYKNKRTEKLNHDYSEWKTTKKATTTTTGLKKKTCKKCGKTKTETIPKKKYNYNIDPRVEIGIAKYTTDSQYRLGKSKVVDRRTWGEPPAITVGDNNSMHVTYYNKQGEKVTFTVEQPSIPDTIVRFTILENGTYINQCVGAYA